MKHHLPLYGLAAAIIVGALAFGLPVSSWWLLALLLVCPLMMMFMMRGGHGEGGPDSHSDTSANPRGQDHGRRLGG